MFNKKEDRLLSLFIASGGYTLPQSSDDLIKISRTVYPYLLGKRDVKHFYDLEKSLYGIRASLEVLKTVVASKGKTAFVNVPSLLQTRLINEYDVNFIKWKRGSLNNLENVDLTVLSEITSENLMEAHRKCLLLVGVGSPTMSGVSYPFNLNVNTELLYDWFFGCIYSSYIRGTKEKKKKHRKNVTGLLGQGQLKRKNAT